MTQTAATPYTGCTVTCTLPTNSTLLAAAADASTIAERLPPPLPSHDDTIHKKCHLRAEQHWYSDADFQGFTCCKLKLINEFTSCLNMPWRWVLKVCSVVHNYKWNNYVMMICVIIPGLPKRTKAYFGAQLLCNRWCISRSVLCVLKNVKSCQWSSEMHFLFIYINY